MFDLTGRTALVTGAGQSVGAGIARGLASQGATVIVNDILASRAEEVATAIDAAGGSASVSLFDVTDSAQVTAAFAAIDGVDIVVNNAGRGGAQAMVPTQFKDMDPPQWEGPIRVNLYGVLNTTAAAINGMIGRGWGRIITISSGAGSVGVNIGVAPYAAAKAAGEALMRTIAAENGRSGVTANAVAIGLMDNVAGGEIAARLAKGNPVGRLGAPADVAAACVYLASEEASWVTGQTLHVDGGAVMT